MQRPQIPPFKNKLIILFLLESCTEELSELQIIRIFQELNIMMYFDLKQQLYEAELDSLISGSVTPNGVRYQITKEGKETLSELITEIDISVRNKIKTYLNENEKDLKNESHYSADCFKFGADRYKVVLRILEGEGIVFEVNCVFPNLNEAQTAVRVWANTATEIYKNTIGSLLFKKEESNNSDKR